MHATVFASCGGGDFSVAHLLCYSRAHCGGPDRSRFHLPCADPESLGSIHIRKDSRCVSTPVACSLRCLSPRQFPCQLASTPRVGQAEVPESSQNQTHAFPPSSVLALPGSSRSHHHLESQWYLVQPSGTSAQNRCPVATFLHIVRPFNSVLIHMSRGLKATGSEVSIAT